VGLREVLCADIAHRKQVCDVQVLRSCDVERCLVATIAAGDVDMGIPDHQPSAGRSRHRSKRSSTSATSDPATSTVA
jgi:hypothetical protein